MATNLLTHTQVLDATVAELTDPTPEAFGAGILRVLGDGDRAAGDRARRPARSPTRATPYEAYVDADARRPSGPSPRAGWQAEAPVSDDHYSYRLYADPAMADRFDAMRFSGPIGTLLAEAQDRVIASFLGPIDGRTVLDVGTGTGRAALGLARRGARVTGRRCVGRDAARGQSAGGRRRRSPRPSRWGTRTGWPTRDRAFHAAVSLRVLMHTPGLAAVPVRVVPGRRRPRGVRLSRGAAARRRSRPSAGALAAAAGRPVEAYRVLTLV